MNGRREAVAAGRSCNVRHVPEEPIEAGQRGGDPVVVAALALGWEMADLYAAREVEGPTPELPATLPGVGRLTYRQTVHATLLRVRTLMRRLRTAITAADATAAGNLLHPTMSAIDQAITKGVLHENTGNRYKSRLTLAFHGLAAKAAK